MLAIEEETVDPARLMSAILKMQADLLWFGGIGTYVKAKAEGHIDVGDPANDPIRVNAEDLNVRVIGEGANLAVTQGARIAFDLKGGRLNADFIDNSCASDLNGDNLVDGQDLAAVLAFWGNNSGGDIDGDGITSGTDLAAVLGDTR